MTTVAVLMTVYNRKEQTLQALRNLHAQTALSKSVDLKVYIVDDGSTDGTSDAITALFPEIMLIQGTGNLFWCGGMRLAYQEAIKHPFDYHLWLNDDTQLFPGAVEVLLQASGIVGNNNIIVGSLQDPDTRELSYGGLINSSKWHPFHYRQVLPRQSPQQVLTMNGNCVLIPIQVAMKVGNLDPSYTHGMGDFDYAFRAGKIGIGTWICSGYIGTCARNSIKGTWKDKNLSFKERWQKLNSPKGLPPNEWKVFTQRYGGLLWPVFWISTYIKLILGR